jgi:hypothetical protein
MTDVAELGLKVDSRQVVQADKALAGMTKSADGAENAIESLNTDVSKGAKVNKAYSASTDKAAKSGRRLGNTAQQAGFQVADLAVQLEGGTSFVRAFGQQGSQLLGAFGPFGAVAGAALAVTAALASTFLTASSNAEELAEKINDLTEDFEDLTAAQRLFLADEQQDKIQKQGETIAGLADKYRDTVGAISSAKSVLETLTRQYEQTGLSQSQIDTLTESYIENVNKLERELRKLDAELDTENSVLATLRDSLMDIEGAYEDVGDAITKKTLTAAESLVSNLRVQAETLGLTAAEAQLYRLELTEGVNPALLEEAEALQKTIDAYKAKTKAQREADAEAKRAAANQNRINASAQRIADTLLTEEEQIRLSYDRRREIIRQSTIEGETEKAEILAELNEQQREAEQASALASADIIIGATQSQITQIQSLIGEQTAASKAFFVVSQGLAAANAVINGFQTAMAIRAAYANAAIAAGPGAPAVIAAGEVQATVATGLGFATAGLIAGQTIASFDGGGFTGSGPRAGGVDGIGGQLAILHPNETVTDHTKGGGMGMNINITNIGGVETSVTRTNEGINIVNEVKQSISSDISRGVGPVTKALQGTFGLNRKGNR